MKTIIVPSYININIADINDAGDYRPVSLATIYSSLFTSKHYILSHSSAFVAVTGNQFGSRF